MAIADRLNKLRTDIEDTYQAITEIGGTIPSDKNTNNIPEAIRSVYDNLPKVSDTGTNVSLNPTLKGRLGIVPKGNTYQESTTGKQLFDKVSATNNQSKYVLNNDGTITNSNNWGNAGRTYLNPISLNADTYTLSYIPNLNGTRTQIRFSLVDGNTSTDITNNAITITNNIKQSYTFTLSDATNLKICIMPNGSSDGTLTLSDVQIEKGSTATSYEPYTGGQPSPNPSYPQEIQSATGTQKVVVSGKNLLDLSKEPLLTQYSNSNFIEPNISIIKTASNQNAYCIFEVGDAKLLDGKILKFTGELVSGTGRAIIGYADSNGENRVTVDGNVNIQSGTFQRTITVDGITYANKKVIIWLYSDVSSAGSVGDTLTYKNVMISTTGGTYQPYQEPQEVDIELDNIELNKIGDYEDYIDGTPDNWVLYKNVEKTVITESNKNIITSFGTQNEHNRILISKTDLGWKTSWNSGIALLNKYKEITSASYVDTGTFATNFTQGALTIWNDSFTNLATAQNLLIGTEILITKAEPEPTPITEEPLVSQLNELYYLQSYNDTTNIDVTGNLPMRITASSIKGA